MKNRSIVIYDGSNFYHKLRSLNLKHTSAFRYDEFSKFLAPKDTSITNYYCVGKIEAKQNDLKAREMMAKQQALVTALKKHKFIIQYGYLLKSDDHYHEKGTDVQIAVNLLRGAYRNEYDDAYLISSDSDLIPAIQEVQLSGKHVVYVGFMQQPSFALLKSCTKSILLTKTDVEPFCS